VAFLSLTVAMLVASGVATALVSRIGPRPLLLAGGAASAGACTGYPGCPSTVRTRAACSARACSPGPGSACSSSRCS
jgi:hypothetical protein